MAPSAPISLRLPGLKGLSVAANTGFFQPDCCSLPADQTQPFPRAWDNYTPEGEERADPVRDLNANSSPASVSKPDLTEKIYKLFCYNFNISDTVWQMSTGFAMKRPRFDFQRHAVWPQASYFASLGLQFLTLKRGR